MWRRLFTLAAKVREMEPWLWVEETDIFGVKDPESDNVVFVSVMGLLGEYHAVALYCGVKALSQFWQMQHKAGEEDVAAMLCDIRQIHAAFGKKSELDASEKRVVKELGLNFKGANTWPYFRGYRPGYFPWGVDAEEARLLVLALEQLLVMAPRIKEDRRLTARKPGTCTYLVRVPEKKDGVIEWHDERRECPPPPTSFRISIPQTLVESVRALKTADLTIEMDVSPSPFRVGEKGERPQVPYLMLAADSESGFVLGVEMLTVDKDVEDMWAQVPDKFLRLLVKNGMRPKRVALRASWVPMVMGGICQDLGIEVITDRNLCAVAEARQQLEQMG